MKGKKSHVFGDVSWSPGWMVVTIIIPKSVDELESY